MIAGLRARIGWGAFDADNDYLYLNNMPFFDHGAMLDPPTEDVTGRCASMLAQLGARPDQDIVLKRSLAFWSAPDSRTAVGMDVGG